MVIRSYDLMNLIICSLHIIPSICTYLSVVILRIYLLYTYLPTPLKVNKE